MTLSAEPDEGKHPSGDEGSSVYATEDKDLKVTFTVNGKVMGSINPKLSAGGGLNRALGRFA